MKRICLALLAVVLLFALWGCANGENDTLSTPQNETESTVSQIFSDASSADESAEASSAPAEPSVVTFFACPDNIIHPSVYIDALNNAAEKNGVSADRSDLHNADYDFSDIYSDFAEDIKNADIAYLNQETLIAGSQKPIAGYPRFNSPRAIAEYVTELGFDVINLAHNHMLDTSNIEGLKNCNELFESLGTVPLGYYPDTESLNLIPVIEKNGIKIAFLTFTYGTNGIKLNKDSAAVIPYFERQLVTQQVESAKEISDFVVVSCHWGDENRFEPNSMQKEYARLMCDLGVDLVLGMHPHVIQPAEWMENDQGHKTLVVYSLGNFVSGMRDGKNMLGLVLEMKITRDPATGNVFIDTPLLIPTVTHRNSSFKKYHIYRLSDYTEELAKKHGVVSSEGSRGTLVGGRFSKENLVKTLKAYIDPQFLPEEFLTESAAD